MTYSLLETWRGHVTISSMWKHRRLLVVLFAVLSVSACQSASRSPSADKGILLITGFDPFGGRSANRSFEVAQEVQAHPQWISDGDVDVQVCLLPTVYDRAAKVALDCLERLPRAPELMISLGEGDCMVDLETAANNLDRTPKLADNAGVFGNGTAILKNAPARQGLTLPTQAMFCSLDEADRARVEVSFSPGNFVCNNTAFLLQNDLLKSATDKGVTPIPYGFIHVPPSTCKPSAQQGSARIVAALIHAAWERRGDRVQALPTTSREIAGLRASQSRSPGADRCESEYWQSMAADIGKYHLSF